MIKKFEEFVNEAKMKVKRSDAEATNVLKGIARVQFYNYLWEDLDKLAEPIDMDEKEEEELRDYLIHTLKVDDNLYKAFLNRIYSGSIYTFEDFKKIVDVLKKVSRRGEIGVREFGLLKILLSPIRRDFKIDYEDKWKDLSSYFGIGVYGKNGYEKRNDQLVGIAIAINGKVITGEVYYNEFLDIYTETEDEMRTAIEKFTSSVLYKEIKMVDDYDIDDFSKVKNYSRVNLDK